MKRLIGIMVASLFLGSAALAAEPKDYQVTGPERIECRGQRRRHAKGGADSQKQHESEDRREESQIDHREQFSSLRAPQVRRGDG